MNALNCSIGRRYYGTGTTFTLSEMEMGLFIKSEDRDRMNNIPTHLKKYPLTEKECFDGAIQVRREK